MKPVPSPLGFTPINSGFTPISSGSTPRSAEQHTKVQAVGNRFPLSPSHFVGLDTDELLLLKKCVHVSGPRGQGPYPLITFRTLTFRWRTDWKGIKYQKSAIGPRKMTILRKALIIVMMRLSRNSPQTKLRFIQKTLTLTLEMRSQRPARARNGRSSIQTMRKKTPPARNSMMATMLCFIPKGWKLSKTQASYMCHMFT